MKSKHTEGKWRIRGIDDSAPDKPFVIEGKRKDVNGDYVVICYVIEAYTKKSTWQKPIISEESKANARLIAAAPEMLEVLKLINDDLNKGSGIYLNTLTKIKSAIAKAEGE